MAPGTASLPRGRTRRQLAATPTTRIPPLDDVPTEQLGGRCVGNSYILIRPIGHGATGTVWRAVDRTSGENVAGKLLRGGPGREPPAGTRVVPEPGGLLLARHERL